MRRRDPKRRRTGRHGFDKRGGPTETTACICDNQVRASFNDWIRVVRNLASNSYIDRNERVVAALRGLDQLSQNCGADFLSRVANGVLDKIGGFNQQQQREERLKARLILRNASWRSLIERAESHRYFRGAPLSAVAKILESRDQRRRVLIDARRDSAFGLVVQKWLRNESWPLAL